MTDTREQIIEQIAQAHFDGLPDDAQRFWDADDSALLLKTMGDGLPIAVKAVTDRVGELHRLNAWGLSCISCEEDYPCRTALLLDQIDAEMGGE